LQKIRAQHRRKNLRSVHYLTSNFFMQAPPIPENEQQRLKELYRFAVLDTEQEQDFEHLVQLASQVCDVPMSLVSLVDAERQWFKAKIGLSASETERKFSFCAHAILNDGVFEITDAEKDDRFFDNPLVTGDPNIRFYAGIPLVTDNGYKLGTFCILDSKPRSLTPAQEFALKTLAKQAMSLLNIRVKNLELERINKLQNKLISIVAHDVRNPLASLKGIIELRQTDIISHEEADEMLGLAALQLDATIDMVANLIDWGKLQMRRDNSFAKQISLKKCVQSVLQAFSTPLEEKNITVNTVADDKVAAIDETGFNFVLRNLLSNSIKFTENGTIDITAEMNNNRIKLKVKDSGTGIEAYTYETLFQQHKHYPTPGTRNEPGSGLGLSLIKDYVDKIEGSIQIHSEKGVGTEVIVVI
jgi:signal transduction histidine kinase